MTRINLGIYPEELCDRHLVEEYRELPRLFGLQSRTPAPDSFKLGSGHVLFCARFQRTLALRFECLVAEMLHRGIRPAFRKAPDEAWDTGKTWAPSSDYELARVRDAVKARICERLASMQCEPRWTCRPVPEWARDAVASRHESGITEGATGRLVRRECAT